jgi:sugar lactone lactonase YvrE
MDARTLASHARRGWGLAVPVATLALLAACSPSAAGGTQTCTASGQGDLTVTVTAPAGVTPAVRVTGPGGYQVDLTATQTLTNLTAGVYLVETLRVTQAPSGGSPVGIAYGAGTDPVVSACVGNATTVSVTRGYVLQPGAHMLWAGNEIGGALVGFTAAELSAGGSQAARVVDLTGSTLNTTYGFQLAFGPHGDLWVSDPVGGSSGNGQLLVFDQSALASSGAPAPALTVEAAAFARPGQLAFDSAGDLYLLDRDANQILEYTAAQIRQMLAAGGSLDTAPAHTYSGSVLIDPVAMAFDHNGNLWVVVDDAAVATGDVQLVRYDAAALGSGGTLSAAYRIRGTTVAEVIGYTGMAFDDAGNLWVVGGGTYRYAQSELTGTGTTTSVTRTTISGSAMGAGPAADADAIDALGNVWVSGSQGRLDRYLLASSTVQTDWLTSSDLTYPMGIALYPSPLAGTLPLR